MEKSASGAHFLDLLLRDRKMAFLRAKQRFGQSSAGDRLALVQEAVPKSTRMATDYWVGVFEKYCQECTPLIKVDIETVSVSELACVLEGYYANVRGKDSTEYKRNSFLAAQGGIQRHLSSFQRGINIFSDHEFELSNKILNGVLKEKKKNGREEVVVHKPVISDKDWQKLEEYLADVLTTLNPRKLRRTSA